MCTNCAKTGDECIYDTTIRSEQSAPGEPSPEQYRQGLKRPRQERASRSSFSENYTSPSSNGWDHQDHTANPSDSIESRLDRLTTLVEALSKRPTETESVDIEKIGSYIEQAKEKNDDKLRVTGRPVARRFSTGRRPTYLTGSESENNSRRPSKVDPVDLADPTSNLNIGYLSLQDGGRSRYVGTTFWAFITEELDQLNQFLRDQNRYYSHATGCPKSEITDESPNLYAEDSYDHNSFHKNSVQHHHKEHMPRKDCPSCQRSSFDKSVLFQAAEAHPSRYQNLHSDSLQDVPTKRQSHVLFRCWLSGVHLHAPLVFPPLVLEKYEQFWNWYDGTEKRNRAPPDPAFMPLLYAIWYAGSVSVSIRGLRAEFTDTPRATLSARLHDQVMRWLTITSFPRSPSLPALIAFLVLQTILAKEEEPLTSSQYVGLAVRVAQTMGLHRDPRLFEFAPWEAEMRRRVWWHIVQMDSIVAVSCGLPPQLTDEHFWDVHLISEIKDVKLGTPEAEEYREQIATGKRKRDVADEPLSRNRPSMVNVSYVAARAKALIARKPVSSVAMYLLISVSVATRQLIRIQLGIKPVTKADLSKMRSIIDKLELDLHEIIDRIPSKGIPEMGFTPDRNDIGGTLVADYDPSLTTPPSHEDLAPFLGKTPMDGLNSASIKYHWNTLASFHKAMRIVLSLSIDKMFCVTYQPFLRNTKSKFWPAARQCALHHCHSYMRKFILLATDPAFQPFHWSWPGTHQPMHAVMIMLVDLYERPDSVEAPISRAFIDKVFSISGPDGGIVSGEDGMTVQRPLREGGREAWDMLRRLREKAWQKAGLDPDVLWTEEDQILMGAGQPLTEAQRIAQAFRDGSVYRLSSQQTGEKEVSLIQEAIKTGAGYPGTEQRGGVSNVLGYAVQQNRLPSSQLRSEGDSAALTSAPLGPDRTFVSGGDSLMESTNPAVSRPVSAMAPPGFNANPSDGLSVQSNPSINITSTPSWSEGVGVTPGAPSAALPTNDTIHDQVLGDHFDWDQWDAVFGQNIPIDGNLDGVNLDLPHDIELG